MDHNDFINSVEAESASFLAALRVADLSAPVPSCPDWNGAELLWHLGGVQHFWGRIVDQLVEDPSELEGPERPPDDALVDFFARSSSSLVAALRERSPSDRCWSWHQGGGDIAWVARRQAHEALIHRVDAELVAGTEITAPETELAADGVDEMLGFLANRPEWAAFTPDGQAIRVEASDANQGWTVAFGRFTGTSPRSGKTYDRDDARVVAEADAQATVAADAWELDLWLWGRGDVDRLELTGDRTLADRLRSVAVTMTQ